MISITSATEAQAALQAGKIQSGSKDTSGVSFSDILKQSFANVTEDMDAIFEEAAAKYQISSDLLKAVAKAESNFNPNAVSGAGAMGVMQLMPGTAQGLGVTDPFDARQNIMGGAKYLKSNLDKFGSVELALAAYNAGPGSVQKYGGIPPYKETQNYVSKVTSYLGGDTLYANKSVVTGSNSTIGSVISAVAGSGSSAGSIGSTLGSLMGSDLLGSYSSLSGYSDSGSYSGLSSYLGLNNYSDFFSGLGSYAGIFSGLAGQQDGDTVTMDKDILANLIQILRIQMMMNADQEIGIL